MFPLTKKESERVTGKTSRNTKMVLLFTQPEGEKGIEEWYFLQIISPFVPKVQCLHFLFLSINFADTLRYKVPRGIVVSCGPGMFVI